MNDIDKAKQRKIEKNPQTKNRSKPVQKEDLDDFIFRDGDSKTHSDR